MCSSKEVIIYILRCFSKKELNVDLTIQEEVSSALISVSIYQCGPAILQKTFRLN